LGDLEDHGIGTTASNLEVTTSETPTSPTDTIYRQEGQKMLHEGKINGIAVSAEDRKDSITFVNSAWYIGRYGK